MATELHLAARRREVEEHERAILDRQEAAEAALVRDFRDRIARGEVVLTGLRTRPNLDPSRSAIPAAWAELLVFDWGEASVRAQEVEYIDVQGERRHALMSAVKAFWRATLPAFNSGSIKAA